MIVSIQFEDRAYYTNYNFENNEYTGNPDVFIKSLIDSIEAKGKIGGKKRKTRKNHRKNKIF